MNIYCEKAESTLNTIITHIHTYSERGSYVTRFGLISQYLCVSPHPNVYECICEYS